MSRREELRQLLNEIRSLRQYIGARYIPKFIDDPWSDLIEYEALSVVGVNGTSYISGETVPVGTPISDRNYWHLYGASSGAIINLQNQIDDMKNGDVPGSLQEQINDNALDITNLTKKVTKRYIFIGDSYGHASGSNNGWIDKLITMMGLSSDDYFESAVGGAGFSTITYSFYGLLDTLLNSMTADDKASITDLVLMGGANDYGNDVSQLKPLINNFVQLAKTNLPRVKIHIGMCAGNWTDSFIGIHTQRLLECYLSGSGYSYINNIEYLFHDRSLIGSDKIHPTNDGYERLANFVYAYLEGKSYKVSYREVNTLVYDSGITALISGVKVLCNIDDNLATIDSNSNLAIEYSTSKNFEYTTSIDTGIDINSNLIKGNTPRGGFDYNGLKIASIDCGVYSDIDSAWHSINCTLSIFGGKIWLTNYDIECYQSTLNVNMRQISKIMIPEFSISALTMYT